MITRNYLLLPHSFFSLSLSFLYGLTLRRIFHSHTTQFEKFSFPFSLTSPHLSICVSQSLESFLSLSIKIPKFLYRRDFLILMEYLSCEIQSTNSSLFFKFSFHVSIQLNSFDLILSKSPKNPLILNQPCSSF